jgi:outer membrane receptor for Fe3+-dicitrate
MLRTAAIDFVLQPAQVAAEISVTSSYLAGTSESLNEIPGSVERIDARTLENARVLIFPRRCGSFPGVNVRDEEGFGLRPNIGIRGTNPTRSTKVLLLEDGLPLSYAPYGDNASYYHPPVERYESIEVLKGLGTNRLRTANHRRCHQLPDAESAGQADFQFKAGRRQSQVFSMAVQDLAEHSVNLV